MSLRVALVHSFYSSKQPSGENTQVQCEVEALRRTGAEVALFAAHTDKLERQPLYQLRSACRVMSGWGTSPFRAVESWQPDIVHVHNLFPNFGRRWVTSLSAPVVVTLHNYRFACANGVLVRDGRPCTDCPDGDRLSGVRHRCYRGSVVATVPVAIGQVRGPAADPVLARADRILCLSARQRRMLEAGGLPAGRLVAWSNFLPQHLDPEAGGHQANRPRRGALYVGRLSAEKGVVELAGSWTGPDQLRMVGDGPLLEQVRHAAVGRPVEVLGRLTRDEVVGLMAQSAALVMPGAVPELAPLTFMEALACGLPVIVRPQSDLAQLVAAHGLGDVVDDVADMAAAAIATANDQDVARRCRATYEARYTERAWHDRVVALYSKLSAHRDVEPAL